MQERNLEALLLDAYDKPLEKQEVVKKKMQELSFKNKKDLSKQVLPDYLRIPDAEELEKIRQWAIDYKKANKQASKREIRKATQEHFHIKIYK